MLLPRLGLCSLLLASPFLGLCQTTDPAPAPRFYVGLGAYSSYYQKLGNQRFLNSGLQVPVQFTAGYQWRPRLAVQVGVAYSGMSNRYSNSGYYYTGPNSLNYYEAAGRYTGRSASVSALARYTLTHNPAHRVQFDALGGLTLERRTSSSRGTRSDSVQSSFVTAPYNYNFSENALLLTLGMGTRYRITPRLELTYDLTFNREVASSSSYLNPNITSSHALGLRYRFGSR